MRQHAWLNAAPERAKDDRSTAPLQTRLEQLRRGNPEFEPEMPPVAAEYLITYLFEVGPAELSGGYSSPVSYQELEAWQRMSGIDLEPWEARFLVGLSREHVSEAFRATKRDAKEPALEFGRGAGFDKAIVAKNLKRLVEEMAKL